MQFKIEKTGAYYFLIFNEYAATSINLNKIIWYKFFVKLPSYNHHT